MAKAFASAGDLTEKQISFTEIGRDLWACTAQGDPKSGATAGSGSYASTAGWGSGEPTNIEPTNAR